MTRVASLAFRVGARLAAPAPPPPGALSAAERRAGRARRLALSALAALDLVTGWALTDFVGHGVVWFGRALPQVFPVRESAFGLTLDPLVSDVHGALADALPAPVAVHVSAVVKHRRDGIDLLPRTGLASRRGG